MKKLYKIRYTPNKQSIFKRLKKVHFDEAGTSYITTKIFVVKESSELDIDPNCHKFE